MAKDFFWLHQIDKEDTDLVGSEAAALGELFKIGVNTPDGFVLGPSAFQNFLSQSTLGKKFTQLLDQLDQKKLEQVEEAAEIIKKAIRSASLNSSLEGELEAGFDRIMKHTSSLQVLGSSENHNLTFSKTPIFVSEKNLLVAALKEIWASFFTRESLIKLKEGNLTVKDLLFSVIFQELIVADVSGIVLTKEKGRNALTIKAIWGLPSSVKSSEAFFDVYSIEKSDLKIKEKKVAAQELQTVKVRSTTKEIPIPELFRSVQKLSDDKIEKLAALAKKIENHFLFPQEIEWAFVDDSLFILQSRPLEEAEKIEFQIEPGGFRMPVLTQAKSIQEGIATGPLKIVSSAKQARKVKAGDILAISSFSKNYLSLLKKSAAVIVSKTPEPSFQNIIRDLGKPTVLSSAKTKFTEGEVVTVNGRSGKIFKGGPRTQEMSLPLSEKPSAKEIRTVTKVFASFSEPSLASEIAVKADGAGLIKGENLIIELGVHPRKVIKSKKQKSFSQSLAKNIAAFTEAFTDKIVVYRISNLLSTDYALLDGGKEYESKESNPLMGFHGTSRLLAEPETLELELEAVKIVRNQMGGKNLWISLPFVRTVEELIEAKKLIASYGLHRSNSFRVLFNLDLPTNLLQFESFLETGIDGVNIELKNLVENSFYSDPNNSRLASNNKTENSVLKYLEDPIRQTRRKGLFVNCVIGRVNNEIVETLVSFGSSSISVPPDDIERTKELISSAEHKLVTKSN